MTLVWPLFVCHRSCSTSCSFYLGQKLEGERLPSEPSTYCGNARKCMSIAVVAIRLELLQAFPMLELILLRLTILSCPWPISYGNLWYRSRRGVQTWFGLKIIIFLQPPWFLSSRRQAMALPRYHLSPVSGIHHSLVCGLIQFYINLMACSASALPAASSQTKWTEFEPWYLILMACSAAATWCLGVSHRVRSELGPCCCIQAGRLSRGFAFFHRAAWNAD